MRFDIITIFPEMFAGVFAGGVVGRAREKGLLEISVHDLRDYTRDRHRQVDDRPYGGLEGMVLKPEPVFAAVEAVRRDADCRVCLLSPQGERFDSAAGAGARLPRGRSSSSAAATRASTSASPRTWPTVEISIGDYVLSGGEPAAVVVVDAVRPVRAAASWARRIPSGTIPSSRGSWTSPITRGRGSSAG